MTESITNTMQTSSQSPATPSKTPRKRGKQENSVTAKSMLEFDRLDVDETSSVNDENNIEKYICKTCHKPYDGTNSYNLVAHLKSFHSEIYDRITGRVTNDIPRKRLELLNIFVGMVTVNGRPFRSLLDSRTS